jgi:hypothetical protein
VLLTDSSWENIRAARMDGLPTYFGNPASQHADAHLDLVGLGHLLALSPGRNQRPGLRNGFATTFGHQRLFVLASGQETRRRQAPGQLEHRGHQLGSEPLTYANWPACSATAPNCTAR